MSRGSAQGNTPIRAAIVAALLGHWIANSLFDRDQYAGAGPALLDRLDDPMLVQAALGLLAIIALTIRSRRREARTVTGSPSRAKLALLLVGVQVVLFLGMEGSERLTIDALAGEQTDVGPFEVGFLAELLVAVGSALILAFAGEAAKRFLGLLRPIDLPARSREASSLPRGHAPATRMLAGAGGVRAPPT